MPEQSRLLAGVLALASYLPAVPTAAQSAPALPKCQIAAELDGGINGYFMWSYSSGRAQTETGGGLIFFHGRYDYPTTQSTILKNETNALPPKSVDMTMLSVFSRHLDRSRIIIDVTMELDLSGSAVAPTACMLMRDDDSVWKTVEPTPQISGKSIAQRCSFVLEPSDFEAFKTRSVTRVLMTTPNGKFAASHSWPRTSEAANKTIGTMNDRVKTAATGKTCRIVETPSLACVHAAEQAEAMQTDNMIGLAKDADAIGQSIAKVQESLTKLRTYPATAEVTAMIQKLEASIQKSQITQQRAVAVQLKGRKTIAELKVKKETVCPKLDDDPWLSDDAEVDEIWSPVEAAAKQMGVEVSRP